MRLIDADELMDHAGRDRLDSRELIMQMIESAPTVCDAKRVSFIRHMRYGSDVVIGNCPGCRKVLGKDNYPNFCGFCGQAVKWE